MTPFSYIAILEAPHDFAKLETILYLPESNRRGNELSCKYINIHVFILNPGLDQKPSVNMLRNANMNISNSRPVKARSTRSYIV